MPVVTFCNSALATTSDTFSGIWKLSRALKKAGWKYLASGDGTNKDTSANPASDKWGGGVAVGGQTGAVASLTTFNYRDITVTGLTGMTAASVGRFLTITGAASGANNGTFQIVSYISATSVTIRNPAAVASDANNGAISWTEVDAASDTYTAANYGNGSWWCAQGPSTLKVPFTTVPSGDFIPGENVTQASGATAEVISVTWDAAGAGWMVLSPRLSGNDSGVRGWAQATITGASSGATVTANGTIIEYVQEIVIWKGTSLLIGSFYVQCLDSVAEATSRFSYLAANAAGCTANIAPGGGGTSNTFPTTGTYVGFGNGGSQSGTGWHRTTYASTFGNAQILVTNAIEGANVSADGTFSWLVGCPTGGGGQAGGFSYQRMDDCEDGDVYPYAFWAPSLQAFNNGFRTRTTDSGVTNASNSICRALFVSHSGVSTWSTWRRRGLSNEGFAEAIGAALAVFIGNSPAFVLASVPSTDPEKVASTAAGTAPLIREPIWVVNPFATTKLRKGTCRWMFLAQGNATAYDSWDTKQWVSFVAATSSFDDVGLLFGPWDGSTVPAQ